jgi:hypothetical protein
MVAANESSLTATPWSKDRPTSFCSSVVRWTTTDPACYDTPYIACMLFFIRSGMQRRLPLCALVAFGNPRWQEIHESIRPPTHTETVTITIIKFNGNGVVCFGMD